ncbi:MAG: phytoene/squalene synthase family protein [Verrucomicrobiota bacterium]|jgi:farnesyl-diphosphate farnesyltransferase
MAEPFNDLLRATSRSFHLTLRILPQAVRHQIGLAYLLARTTDTIADTELVPLEQRLESLHRLRERILGQSTAPLNFGELARQQGSPAERLLLEKVEGSLAALQQCSPGDQKLMRDALATITGGQELDLRRFARATLPPEGGAPNILALETAAELDDYTYRVAGCVGEFWTKICRAHLFPTARIDEAQLIDDGVRFGKGLQLVNILRDVPADLHRGRCYLPTERLEPAGLLPEVLLSPANETRFRPLFHEYLDKAQAHLAAGWAYTNALPRNQVRVRLACAWPILIGVKTIERLRAANVLELRQGIKIPRRETRRIIVQSVLRIPFAGAWRSQF